MEWRVAQVRNWIIDDIFYLHDNVNVCLLVSRNILLHASIALINQGIRYTSVILDNTNKLPYEVKQNKMFIGLHKLRGYLTRNCTRCPI